MVSWSESTLVDATSWSASVLMVNLSSEVVVLPSLSYYCVCISGSPDRSTHDGELHLV